MDNFLIRSHMMSRDTKAGCSANDNMEMFVWMYIYEIVYIDMNMKSFRVITNLYMYVSHTILVLGLWAQTGIRCFEVGLQMFRPV